MISISGDDIKAVRGDDVIIELSALSLEAQGEVVFTAKSSMTDVEPAIQVTAADGKFHLTPTDTATAGLYYYDIQQTSENIVTTLKMGKFRLVQDVNS